MSFILQCRTHTSPLIPSLINISHVDIFFFFLCRISDFSLVISASHWIDGTGCLLDLHTTFHLMEFTAQVMVRQAPEPKKLLNVAYETDVDSTEFYVRSANRAGKKKSAVRLITVHSPRLQLCTIIKVLLIKG